MSEQQVASNDEEKQLTESEVTEQHQNRTKISLSHIAHRVYAYLRKPIVLAIISLCLGTTRTAIFYSLYNELRFNNSYCLLSVFQNSVIILVLASEWKWPAIFTGTPRYRRWIKFMKIILWIVIAMSIILRIIFLSSISKTNDVDDPDYLKSLFSFNTPPNIAYLTITILGIIVDSFLLTVWWSVSLKTYHIAFAFISMFQFCTGIAEIQININTMRADVHNKFNPKLCNMYVYIYTFLIVQSISGFLIAAIINEENRLTYMIGQLVSYYCIYGVLMVLFMFSALMVTAAIYNQNSNALPLSNSILLGCNVACAVGLLFIAWHFRRRLPPAFQVEEYDISKLSPFQLEGFAILMERNFKYNGGISGKAAISLIKSYLACDLPGMRTKLIRTYNTNKSNPSKLWDTLDEEDILFRTRSRVTSDSATYIENDPFDVQSYKPLLKNQLKKLQKKDKNKNKKEAASLELLAENSQEFYDVLCNTESITLLTIIDKYDLSLYIPAKLGGKVLNKYFGADSKLPLLCIRFGLLGFHWPFRRSTFYCSPPKKPVARAGAVLYALSKWNSNLPRSERCRVLLDPTFKTPDTEKVLAVSGWYTAPIPNGHIIDLRPYTKKTPEQYFKLVKYRVQVQPFKQDKGEVIYIDNPLVEDCDLLMERWGDIYKRREQGGQSSYLINPTTNFVYSMVSFESGEHNANDDRSLMFLKVGDEYIASCIIFRLGKTITSDIQGLNGEISKKYKAYFVMMQEVIKLAFAEGKEFVDFGPTTEQPKVDIGCSIVPLVGSFDAGNPVMSWIVQIAAKHVDV